MAKVIKKRNELLEKRNRAIILHFSGYAACLLFGILGIELSFAGIPGWICMILGLLSLAGAVMIHCTRDQMGVLGAGVSGEKNAVHILEKALPDHYYCVTNVQVSYENRHNELDAVVVGPTGIYIVEVKNVSGRICGSYTDKQFLQDKGKRSKEMDNPVYQVKMHADILSRFLKAQEHDYARALQEIQSGRKRSHWMWYIFPQIIGLGSSSMSTRYAIRDLAEARAYLAHPVLGARLREAMSVVLTHRGRKSAREIFSSIGAMKLRSSATLFNVVSPGGVFKDILDAFYSGSPCEKTLAILGQV